MILHHVKTCATVKFSACLFWPVPLSQVSLFYRVKCCCRVGADGASANTQSQTEFLLQTATGFSAGCQLDRLELYPQPQQHPSFHRKATYLRASLTSYTLHMQMLLPSGAGRHD